MNFDQSQMLVVYLLLFILVGVGFILVHLLVGKVIRPAKPESEKLTIYECGEPTIGSAWVQFDVRFYVVALLFVIFDVEVAFFFPWAVVFGRANQLSNDKISAQERVKLTRELVPAFDKRSRDLLDEFEKDLEKDAVNAKSLDENQGLSSAAQLRIRQELSEKKAAHIGGPRSLAWMAFFDIAIFFGVLLVGFAYLWKRGDLQWVRSTSAEKLAVSGLEPPAEEETLVAPGSDKI